MSKKSSNSDRKSGDFPWGIVALVLGLVILLGGCSAQYANGRYYPFTHMFEVTIGLGVSIGGFASVLAWIEKRPSKGKKGPRGPVNWEAAAESINRFYILSERWLYIDICCGQDTTSAELLGGFGLRNNEPKGYQHWMAVASAEIPERFAKAHVDDYVSIKYGNDAFLSQMDSDTTIEIVVSKYGGIAMAYFLGYTGIPSGYYLDEIRQNINPILERKKYRCRVLPNGRITA